LLPDQRTLSDADEGQGAWARPVPARLAEVILALVLIASGLFFMWYASSLPFGTVGLPGPGFFPFVLGIALVLLASAILYLVWRGKIDGDAVFLGHRDVLLAVLAMAGVAFAFERVDAYLALGGFAAFLLLFVARTAPWRAVLGAALGMVAVWLFFALALGVRLPAGEFWQQIADFVTGASSSGQP
jgi:hypothetical protein